MPPVPTNRTRRPLVLAALMLAMFVSAIEATIVATALPSIVEKLGGLALYSWVFSGFLLMQAMSIPIYGKLADLFGRKRVFIIGSVIFLVGSSLCALAWSMMALVVFRLVQGLGAGSIQSLATTMTGDLYSREERGRVQAYVSSVWGISAIVGPFAGALIVQHASWNWIFWINLPFGIASIAMVVLFFHEEVQLTKASIDYAGAALMLTGLLAVMLAFTQSGRWGVAATLSLLALFAVSLWLFIGQERRAPDPVMHLDLWKTPVIAVANLATLAAGIAMIGVISFMPIFIQNVQGGSSLVAGAALCAMSVGWPLASVITGRVLTRVGLRLLCRVGGCTVLAGGVVIAAFIEHGPTAAAAGSFIMGAGLGILNAVFIVSIQSSVAWSQRGVAIASNMLMRILGNTLGAAVFGGVLNLALQHPLESTAASSAGLASGLHIVFWAVVVFAAVSAAACWFVPDFKLLDSKPSAK